MAYTLTVKDVWEDVFEYIRTVILTECRTDEILVNKLDQLILHVEQDLMRGVNITPRLLAMHTVLNSDSYYENSALSRATSDEKAKVRELGKKLTLLLNVAKRNPLQPQERPVYQANDLPNRGGDVRELYHPITKSE